MYDTVEQLNEAEAALDCALVVVGEEVGSARYKFLSNRALFKALVEEVGELATALLLADPSTAVDDGGDVYREACQVAAVAVRIMTEGECPVKYLHGEDGEETEDEG